MTLYRLNFPLPDRDATWNWELAGDHPQDAAIAWYLDQRLFPEPEMIHVMARAIRPGDMVVDCGACTGFFTVLMGALGASVLAIEPGGNNLPTLYRNIGLNNFAIDVRPCALGAENEYRDFLLIDDGGANSFTQPADRAPGSKIRVDVRRLPDLVHSDVRLIKMDIEGGEYEALTAWFDGPWKCPYIAVEYNLEALNRMDVTGAQLQLLMRSHGYSMWMLFSDGILPLWIPPGVEVKCSRQNTNVLFATPADVVALWPELQV
jgi:FkbM family methyltransferase